MSTVLACFDPSLRASAYFVVDIDTCEPITAGAFELLPHGAENRYAIEDVRDEARTVATVIVRGIVRLLRTYEPAAVALETPLGAKDARAAWGLARANQAVVDAIALGAPDLFDQKRVFFVSAYGAKWAATGSKVPKGGKADVRDGVIARFGRTRMAELAAKARSSAGIEGVHDAAAVALLAMRLPQVKALRAQQDLEVRP